MRTVVVAIVLVSSTARADVVEEQETERSVHVGLAMNPPIEWDDTTAVAGSVYVGLTDHQVIRGNFATYKARDNAATGLAIALIFHPDDEAGVFGRVNDVGVAWQYYWRRRLDGPMFELGPNLRFRNSTVTDDNADVYSITTDTRMIAARALIGWTWSVRDAVFCAIGVGLSAGYEWGHETTIANDRPETMPVTSGVRRLTVAPEGYVRLGIAFDLTETLTTRRARP